MASSVKTSSWTKEIRERNKIGDEEKFMQQYGYLCKHKIATPSQPMLVFFSFSLYHEKPK